MRRAVIDQPGIRITFIGLIVALILGLSLRNQISDARIAGYLNKSVQRLQKDFIIDYDKARINLSKWGLPFPVLEITNIRLSPKSLHCRNSQVYVDQLEVPITISMIFGFSTKVPRVRIREMELRLADTDRCVQDTSSTQVEKTSEHILENHSLKPDERRPAQNSELVNSEGPKEVAVKNSSNSKNSLNDLFSRNTKGELGEILIEKLKIIAADKPDQPILLKQVSVDLIYNQNKLIIFSVKSKLNAIRDAKSDIYFINANLNLNVKSISNDAVDCVISIEGKLLDGDVQFFAHYLSGAPKFNYEIAVEKVSLKAVQPLLDPDFRNKIRGLDKVPVSLSFNNSGEVFVGKDQKVISTFKKIVLNVENAQVKSNAVNVIHENSITKVEPFEFLIDALPLSRFKGADIFKGKLDSFESLGVVSGKLSYENDENVKFDGILRGLEVVFSNRGRRDLQTIDEMNFHFRKNNKYYSLEASGLVSGNEKIDGALTIEHYADTDKTAANLKLSGIIFNKKVWDQFTFVEQAPKVDVSWSYEKSKVENYSMRLHADSIELPGITFSNLNLDLSRYFDPTTNLNSLQLVVKPMKVVTSERLFDNEQVNEIFASSIGLKGQIFSGDKFTVTLTGSDWRNLNFNVDATLVEAVQKIPHHLVLKGKTNLNTGVSAKLTLSARAQNFNFDLSSTVDSPLVIKASE